MKDQQDSRPAESLSPDDRKKAAELYVMAAAIAAMDDKTRDVLGKLLDAAKKRQDQRLGKPNDNTGRL